MEWQIKRKKFTSHSEVVRGIVGSSIVVTTSTKGTPATAALNKSGLILSTPPISEPPALLPFMQSLSLEQNFFSIKCSAHAIKSVKVFFFFSSFPFSYHCLPISPPPRIWAITYMKPRSNNESLDDLKLGSMHACGQIESLDYRIKKK